jgi:hypothetical protein
MVQFHDGTNLTSIIVGQRDFGGGRVKNNANSEVLCDFSQSLEGYAEIVFYVKPVPFSSPLSAFNYPVIITDWLATCPL